VRLWDVETRDGAVLEGHDRKVRELAWSANGRWLATGGGAVPFAWTFIDGEGDIESDGDVRLRGHDRPIVWTGFQPHGPLLATAGQDGLVLLWSLPAEAPVSVTALGVEAGACAWSPDGSRLALGGADGAVTVFAMT
jgi:WD40 repeat protein